MKVKRYNGFIIIITIVLVTAIIEEKFKIE